MTEEILLLTNVYKLMNPVPYVIAAMEKKVEKNVESESEKQPVVNKSRDKKEKQDTDTSNGENKNMYILSIVITIIAGVYVLYKLKKVK